MPCPDIFSQCCAVVTGSQKPRRCPRCWRETCCSFDLSLSSRQHQLSSTSLKQLKKMLFSVIPVHFLGTFMSYLCRYGIFLFPFFFLLIHKSVWRNNIFTLKCSGMSLKNWEDNLTDLLYYLRPVSRLMCEIFPTASKWQGFAMTSHLPNERAGICPFPWLSLITHSHTQTPLSCLSSLLLTLLYSYNY